MYDTEREESTQLNGMGGWLAFLVACLTALWPLAGLVTIYEGFITIERTLDVDGSAAWLRHKRLIWLFFAAGTVTLMLAGYRLYREHVKASVRFAVYAIWLAGPALNLAAILAGILIAGVPYAGCGFWPGFSSIVFPWSWRRLPRPT